MQVNGRAEIWSQSCWSLKTWLNHFSWMCSYVDIHTYTYNLYGVSFIKKNLCVEAKALVLSREDWGRKVEVLGEWQVASGPAPQSQPGVWMVVRSNHKHTSQGTWAWSLASPTSVSLAVKCLPHLTALRGRPLINCRSAILLYGIKNYCPNLHVFQVKLYFCWKRAGFKVF